ncbi:MAG: lamin tail domain-containing protein [Cyclobacteriaceae bacterium]
MKKFSTALLFCFVSFLSFSQLSTGDIAFVGFNADGDSDFAIVTLVDIPASTEIYFTDRALDGQGGLSGTSEGILLWNSGSVQIDAGSIIVFTDVDAGSNVLFGASAGTLTVEDTNVNLSADGDALFAFQGSSSTTPTTFLAGVANRTDAEPTIAGTGLTLGNTFVEFNNLTSPDGGYYSGPKDSKASFAEYHSLIGLKENWTQSTSDGESLLPFPTTPFSLTISQTLGFSPTTTNYDETNTPFNIDIPVAIANYGDTQVDLAVAVTGGTAEPGDYVLNTTTLSFTENGALNISVTINDDADDESETIEITLTETSSTQSEISPNVQTITINDDDVAPLVITEIYYNPANGGDEFIEIYNAGQSVVNLEGYTSDAFTINLPSGTNIDAGEYIVFTSDMTNFTGAFDVYEWTSGALTNTGETVNLKNSSGAIVDEVTFTDDIEAANGNGSSLTLADPSLDNSDMTNWVPSIVSGGTPGAANDASVWTGNVDDELITTGNWTNGAPTASLSLLIPATSSVIAKVNDNLTAGALKIGTSKSLIIQSGALKVNGDIINDGFIEIFSGASLLPMGNVEGSGSTTVMRNTTFSTSEGRYSIVGSPIENATTASLGSIVYSYDETADYGDDGSSRFVPVTQAENMTPGDAYFSAKTGSLTFTGTPNTGTIAKSLTYVEPPGDARVDQGNNDFNLVSNPYTAALDIVHFLTDNTDVAGTIYIWQDENSANAQGSNADYVIYNAGNNVSTRGTPGGRDFDGYARSTQGFFVLANAGTQVTFEPDMMSDGNNSDAGYYRKGQDQESVRFSMNTKDKYSDIVVVLREDATMGYDRLLDSHTFPGGELKLYSYIDNTKFAIQSLPNFESKISIDLGFDSKTEGTHELKIEEGEFEGYFIYLIDSETEELINLTSERSYTFETEIAHESRRFHLLLSKSAVLSFNGIDKSEFRVFRNDSQLKVVTREAHKDAHIRIYHIDGTLALEAKNINLGNKTWTTGFNKEGAFIMTIETANGLLVKKFVY